MKNILKSIVLLALLPELYMGWTATVRAQSQDTLQIKSARVTQDTKGNYKIIILFNQRRANPPDAELENAIKGPENYLLREKDTGVEVKLSEQIVSGIKGGLYQIILKDINITYRKKYIIEFEPDLPFVVEPKEIVFREGEGTDVWEADKSEPWQRSIKPKLAQGDSTINELGDIGLDILLRRKLPGQFEFNFDASVTLNKNDPNNHWKLNLFWRSGLWLPSSRFGLRPISLRLQDNATQALRFHDFSVSAVTSIFIHPFDGIQPIFMTAGFDQAMRLNFDGEDFDDPRINLQVQWGMVGLVGKGSSFFVEWQFWRRLNDFLSPKIDPAQDRERQFIQFEFVLPITDDKNITVRYAEGEIAPTFADDSSVHLGLEFFFGGKRFLIPKTTP